MVEELRGAFIVAVLSASVVSALIAGAAHLVSDKWHRAFQREEREYGERRDRSEAIREQHLRARDEHLPLLVAVIAFIAEKHKEVAEDRIGFIVAYHPEHDERVADWGRAMAELRRIALLHPSADVRQRSQAVQHEIQKAWVDPLDDPDLEQFSKWLDELRQIAELMH